jgi:hypothetical protein
VNELEQLVRAVVAQFAGDATLPSVVTSWLGDRWYVSVVRYLKPYAQDKVVLVNCTGDDLGKLYAELLELFHG